MLRVNLTGLQIQDLTSWYGPETFTKVKCPVWYVQDMQIYNLVKRNAELKNPHTAHFNMITGFKLQKAHHKSSLYNVCTTFQWYKSFTWRTESNLSYNSITTGCHPMVSLTFHFQFHIFDMMHSIQYMMSNLV